MDAREINLRKSLEHSIYTGASVAFSDDLVGVLPNSPWLVKDWVTRWEDQVGGVLLRHPG